MAAAVNGWDCPECGNHNMDLERWCWTCGTERPDDGARRPVHEPPIELVKIKGDML
jgi:hypothetical protein